MVGAVLSVGQLVSQALCPSLDPTLLVVHRLMGMEHKAVRLHSLAFWSEEARRVDSAKDARLSL